MIRNNLSTRPFYNERAVNAWLAVFAAIVVVATVFNVGSVIPLASMAPDGVKTM